MVPTAVLTQSKPVPITAVRPVSTTVPKTSVTRPKQVQPIVTKTNSPPKRHTNRSPSPKASNSPPRVTAIQAPAGNPQHALKDKGVINSGCSRHMTRNMSYLFDFEVLNGGYVAFGGNPKGDKISGKEKIRTGKLDFDDVYFVKELKFNIFSVSQMCDKKNSVLFTDTECLVLSPEFKLPDESQVLLRVPRENNMYNVNLKNIVPSRDLTCLFTKVTIDVSNLWHRRLGYINFKTMNKVVKGNLVRGLPTKVFKNDNTCVACKKGKQHRATYKTKPISSVNQPLYRLYMDLFGPTYIKSLNKKSDCLVVTDDYSRTLIEAARTMLADSLLPIPFWAKSINTACYVQNKVLVTKPYNKTPYELLHGRTPSIDFIRPFTCPVTILNTLDSLGKFDGKVDEGFLVGYSVSSKAFRVFNSRTRIVQETLHVNFLENKPNVAGSDPTWLFDIDSLPKTMNYQPVTAGNQSNHSEGFQDQFDAEKAKEEIVLSQRKKMTRPRERLKARVLLSLLTGYRDLSTEFEDHSNNNINKVNAAGTLVPTVGQISPNSTNTFSAARPSNVAGCPTHGKYSFIDASQLLDDPDMPELEDITYSHDEDDVDHHVTQIIGDISSATQTRNIARVAKDKEPNRVDQALKDPSYIEAMQEELLQFKMQKVWVLVDLSYGKRAIGTKWVFQNKKDERDIVIRNKAGLFGQGHTQDNGIDYEEVFAPVARIEAIRLFLAYASFMGFMVYQMDAKSAFLYGTIKEEVYVCQPLGFKDPNHPDKVYKVVKVLYGLHQAPRACQDKYVAKILRKFRLKEGKSASTPIDTEKPLLKDPDGVNTPRCDKDRLELIELTVLLLPKVDKVRIGVSAVDLQVSTIRLMLLLLVQKLLVFGLTNWCCSPSAVSSIKYALIVNPNIYVSCIKQFWTTIVVKMVNDVIRLQALVDKKKVVCMSAKRTSWNEFSSSMASAVICLSSGRKLNFYKKQVGDLSTHTIKYTSPALTQKVFANVQRVGKWFSGVDTPFFDGMLVAQEVEEGDADENVENVNVGDATEGDLKRRVKKLERRNKVKVLKLRRLQKVGTAQKVETSDETMMDDVSNQERMIAEMDVDVDVVLKEAKEIAAENAKADQDSKVDESVDIQGRKAESQEEIYKIDLEHANKVLSMQEDKSEPAELQKVVDVVTTAKIITEVVTAASETITAASTTITAETQVLAVTLTAAPSRITVAPSRRRKGVVIRDPEESTTPSTIIPAETESNDKAKVKGWKLLESCGVQIITFTTTQLILLVERKYPLTRFTPDQMLNVVRLGVEEESKVSLELLSFGVDAAKEVKKNMLSA
nr:putative ribonuclease H-like domain-containing protein [Tanacetum cinerariifolium]